jgi:hypothetical protein
MTGMPPKPFHSNFVDNVTTSGNTRQAASAALGFGAGLVFADGPTAA